VKVLWLVTARSQSRSIPDKNILELGGHPLLAYRVSAALCLAPADDVWVSTDSQRYAEIAGSYGATVPFLRPAELASDAASSVDVVLHAMEHAEATGRQYDAIGLLEPTSPFVLPATIENATRRLSATTAAAAIVATRVSRPSTIYIQPEAEYLSEIARRLGERPPPRRQEERVEITPSGGFHVARWEQFRRRPAFYTQRTLSHDVSALEALDIDEPLDWEWARFLIAEGYIDPARFGLRPR